MFWGNKKAAPKNTLRRENPAVPLKLQSNCHSEPNSPYAFTQPSRKGSTRQNTFFPSARKLQTLKIIQWLTPTATSLCNFFESPLRQCLYNLNQYIIFLLKCQQFFQIIVIFQKEIRCLLHSNTVLFFISLCEDVIFDTIPLPRVAFLPP